MLENCISTKYQQSKRVLITEPKGGLKLHRLG